MNFFCSKDCPDLCGINHSLTDGRHTFKGVPEKWSETGFVCSKFKVFAEREINNGIKSYQVKDGSKVTYETDEKAVAAMADFLEKYRDKKILYMRGSGSLAYNMACWDVFFSHFENCWATSGNPCDETGMDAHKADFGVCVNPDITNLEETDTIILYGKNAAVCSQHSYAYFKELKKKGKTIIYTDPVRTKTAELADRYIMINPGCDGLLACALLNELGHESGHDTENLLKQANVTRKDFQFILDRIKTGRVGHVQGFGIQRHSNGMNAFQWINRLAVKTDCTDLLYFAQSSKRQWAGQNKSFKGHVNIDRIAEVLEAGEFDLFVNVAGNPAMTFSDTNRWVEGLKRTKTLVVDTNHTETSAHADFFLKVGGMFSQDDFMGSYFFSHDYTRKAVTEEMSDTKAANALGDKMGIPMQEGYTPERVPHKEKEYVTESLELMMPETSDKFQFITSSHHTYLNSQILPGMEKGLQVVHINTKDAEKLKIKDGQDVLVTGETGQFTAEALITDGIAEKTIMCWKNIPMKKGYLNNAIPVRATDSGSGLNYYTIFVDVKPL